MQQTKRRRYPVGIQTFSRIRREGYVYVDKTDLVWEMANEDNPFLFLARPRRFGKSLLASTLHSFFAGERELFRGLKVDQMEWDWQEHPVLHFDLSVAKNQPSAEKLRETLMWLMQPLAEKYDVGKDANSPGKLLSALTHKAFERTQTQVAIIIDEYDAPLLDVLHSDQQLQDMRQVMQEFYSPL